MRHIWLIAVVASSCTAIDTTVLPSARVQGDVFITQESILEPYESLGVVQVTRRGVLLFGFADPAGTDLEAAVAQLVPEVLRAGADGAMNVRFAMTQYTLSSRLVGLLFFFAPLPAEVTVTAELVKLRRGAAPTVPAVPVAPL